MLIQNRGMAVWKAGGLVHVVRLSITQKGAAEHISKQEDLLGEF